MGDDEASQLSLDYNGSQSPLPPSPVLARGRRYFGHVDRKMQPIDGGAPAAEPSAATRGDRSEAATAAEPLRTHHSSHHSGTMREAPADVVLSGSRTAAPHRTEHRRQAPERRHDAGSDATWSARGGRDAARDCGGGEEPERRRGTRDSDSRHRHHSPVPKRHHSSAERADGARRRGSSSGRSPNADLFGSRSGGRDMVADRQLPARTSDHRRSGPAGERQRGVSRSPGRRRHRSRSPGDRRAASPQRQLRQSHDSGSARHHSQSSRAAAGRNDDTRRRLRRHPSPTALPDDQQRGRAPDAAVGRRPPEAAPMSQPPRQHAVDARVDFCSPQFDALLALYTPELQLPNPRAAPLDFVMQCRNLLPPEDEHWLPPVDRSMPSKSQLAREAQGSRTGNAAAAAAKAAAREAPLDTIAGFIQAGPLMLLKQAYEARGAVRVVTRHARGVRGVATGMLLGFDKHMNLILRDVEETYTVLVRVCRQLPPRTANGAHAADTAPSASNTTPLTPSLSTAREPEGAVAGPAAAASEPSASSGAAAPGRWRSGRKQEVRRRSLRQVFVRGDNIVLVSRVGASTEPDREESGRRTSPQQVGTSTQAQR